MLKKFYKAKVEEIRLRYESICELVEHNGEKGIENELILIDFLKEFLPKSYSVGRGFIIDSNGNTSNQCDIVIYDNLYNPNIIKLSSNTYFPVESVYCVIEVKTTVRDEDMKKSFEDEKKMKGLSFKEEKVTFTRGGALLFSKTEKPNYFLFGYKSDSNDPSIISTRYKANPVEICFILNMGTLSIVKDKTGKNKAQFEIAYLNDFINQASNQQKQALSDAHTKHEKFFEWNCIKYPILQYSQEIYLVDYVKNFLIFLFLLNHYVSNKQIGKNYLKHYFPLNKILSIPIIP